MYMYYLLACESSGSSYLFHVSIILQRVHCMVRSIDRRDTPELLYKI